MTKFSTTVLGATLLFAGAASIQAQETKPMGLSIRAGLFFTSNSDARHSEGNSWFAGGLEYKIKDVTWGGMGQGYAGHISLSADLISKGDFKNMPILLNYVGRRNEWYYTAGAGVSFSSLDGDDRTRLGYQLGFGYDFSQGKTPFFLEAKYWGTSKSEFNGFGIYAGIRL